MQRKKRTGKLDREEKKGYHLRTRCGSSGSCEGGGGAEKRQCSEVDEMDEPVGERKICIWTCSVKSETNCNTY
ncbi:hypothetical protein LB503_007551 [Fusarium chuoi]|nr:hypothetical protein LB503_007551 [Fusarium chuoi]